MILSTLKSFWMSLFWAIIILLLSTLSIKTQSCNSLILKIPHLDKVVHMGLYFIWASLILVECDKHYHRTSTRTRLILFVFISLYGCLMELFQYIGNNNRQADWLDALFNSSGTIFSILLYVKSKWFLKMLSFIFRL